MNLSGVYRREKRNPAQMYHPMHNSVASYWTEALHKNEMKYDFADDYFLQNIHLIPDPLKKNLADTLFNTETPKKPEKVQQELKVTHQDRKVPSKNMSEKPPPEPPGTALGGMRGFFSGVMNVLTSVMFRSRSPVNYYDCFDVDGHQGSPPSWQCAKTDEQDKNGQAAEQKTYDALPNPNVSAEMNSDRATVTSCENKLNQVLHLLSARQTSNPVWVRKRPKKVFVDPGSVCESFEDAFTPEDFSSLPNDSYIEYYTPVQHHCEVLCEAAAPKTKLNLLPKENTDVKDVTNKSDLELQKNDSLEYVSVPLETDNLQTEKVNLLSENCKPQSEMIMLQLEQNKMQNDLNIRKKLENSTTTVCEIDYTDMETPTIKNQLVSSCEDKLSRLKALLQEKRMKCKERRDLTESLAKSLKTIPAENKTADKRYKNPRRRTSKRSSSKLKCRIEEDLVFANEVNLGTPPSTENSPRYYTNVSFGDYFDEVSGRFRSESIGSDDSFQIVFNDCSKSGRVRTTSDCDSEDSFIVFEDSPDCCYTTTDVFGDSESESEMSDSGCGMVTCKLAHTLTRTVSNLADDSLYIESEDEVDFANMETVSDVVDKRKCGLLLDDAKKLKKKCQPAKKVQFSSEPPKVHVMRVWAFAARQARAGHWERYAVDRDRFKQRIANVEVAISWVLQPQHRSRVMFQRFMPWWNQLKRKALAEKKEKDAEDKRQEEQRRRDERTKEEDELEAERVVADDVSNKDDLSINDSEEPSRSSKSVVTESKEDEKGTECDNSDFVNDKIQKEELETDVKTEDSKLLEFNNNPSRSIKSGVTEKLDEKETESDNSDFVNDNIQKEESGTDVRTEVSKLLEYNNNKISDCEKDNGKINSNLIIRNGNEENSRSKRSE